MQIVTEEISDPSGWGNVFSQEAIIAISFAALFVICNTLILFRSQVPHKVINKIADIFPILKFFGIGRRIEVEVAPRINTETCCFCCADIQREVGATCGHIFCGKCMIEFWEIKNKAKLQCPLCRRAINMIMINFPRDNIAQNDEITKKVLEEVKVYNICFSNQPRTLYQVLLDFPYLMNRFVSSLITREGFLFFLRKILGSLYIVILIIYIISPLDLIPDYIVLVGWLDDAIVFIYLMLYITVLYYNFLQQGN